MWKRDRTEQEIGLKRLILLLEGTFSTFEESVYIFQIMYRSDCKRTIDLFQ